MHLTWATDNGEKANSSMQWNTMDKNQHGMKMTQTLDHGEGD